MVVIGVLVSNLSYGLSLIDTTGLTDPLILEEHPRLFVTSKNFSTIVKWIKEGMSGYYNDLLEFAHSHWEINLDSLGSVAEGQSGYVYSEAKKLLQTLIEVYGFIYLFMDSLPDFNYQHSKLEYGERGVTALMNLPEEENPGYVFQHHNHGCRPRYTGLACGYDWLYPLLTEEQRREVASRLIHNCIIALDSSYYDYEESASIHNFLHFKEMIGGLACYGDGFYDEECERIIDHFYSWQVERGDRVYAVSLLDGGGLDVQYIVSGDGMNFDGFLYLEYTYGFLPFLCAWYTATGQDFFELSSYYQNLPLSIVYHLLPTTTYGEPFMLHKMHLMRIGDKEVNVGRWMYPDIFAYLCGALSRSNSEMASLSRWICEKIGGGFGIIEGNYAIRLTTTNPEIPSQGPKEIGLPLVHKFENHGVSMRSSWDDPDATFSTIAGLRFRINRERIVSGSFTIWKNRGYLILHRGLRSHQDKDSRKPWYWNSLLLGDNDEGQRDPDWMSNAHYFLTEDSMEYKVGGIEEFEWKEGEYVYILIDGSREYERIFPGELELFKRKYIWLPGDHTSSPLDDYFVIFDQIKTKDTLLKKEIIFNTAYRPYILSTSWDTSSTLPFTELMRGHYEYDNPHNVVIINNFSQSFHGDTHLKGFMKILLPKECKITLIGGPHDGYDGEDGKTDFNHAPFDPKGDEDDPEVEYDPPLDELYDGKAMFYGGGWRMELTSKEKKEYELFLTTIQATDLYGTPERVELVEGEKVIGVIISDRIVLFSKDTTKINKDSVEVKVEGEFKLLLCDLKKERKYEIKKGTITDTLTSSTEGIIYCVAEFPGEIEIREVLVFNEEEGKNSPLIQRFKVSQTIGKKEIKIEYLLGKKGKVRIKMFNILGRMVKELINKIQLPGKKEITIVSNFPQGIYFVILEIENKRYSKKLVIIK